MNSKNIDMKMPDFKEWTNRLLEAGIVDDIYTGRVILNHFDSALEEALKQAFEQGYHYGLNYGWVIEQDKQYSDTQLAKDCDRAYERIMTEVYDANKESDKA